MHATLVLRTVECTTAVHLLYCLVLAFCTVQLCSLEWGLDVERPPFCWSESFSVVGSCRGGSVRKVIDLPEIVILINPKEEMTTNCQSRPG
jgi:hypothetical protein